MWPKLGQNKTASTAIISDLIRNRSSDNFREYQLLLIGAGRPSKRDLNWGRAKFVLNFVETRKLIGMRLIESCLGPSIFSQSILLYSSL